LLWPYDALYTTRKQPGGSDLREGSAGQMPVKYGGKGSHIPIDDPDLDHPLKIQWIIASIKL